MIEKKKILIIAPSGHGGIASVIDSYKEAGLCKDILYMSSYKASYGLVNLIYFPLFLIKYFLIILKKNIKLIHIHSSCRGSFLRKSLIFYIAKLFKKKTIFHIHGADFNNFYDNSPSYLKKMISNVLNRADLILALSEQWKKDLIQRFPHSNVEFLYNPAYIKVIEGKKDNKIINVLFMGILDKRKGIYDIIEAAKYINNDKVKINLFGNGNLSKIKNIINKNNLENKISVNGWINAPKKFEKYVKADIFLLPSFNEGLPMSIRKRQIMPT